MALLRALRAWLSPGICALCGKVWPAADRTAPCPCCGHGGKRA